MLKTYSIYTPPQLSLASVHPSCYTHKQSMKMIKDRSNLTFRMFVLSIINHSIDSLSKNMQSKFYFFLTILALCIIIGGSYERAALIDAGAKHVTK